MQWNIGNIIMIVNKRLEINQILAFNNPWRFDMPLNNQTKLNLISFLFLDFL